MAMGTIRTSGAMMAWWRAGWQAVREGRRCCPLQPRHETQARRPPARAGAALLRRRAPRAPAPGPGGAVLAGRPRGAARADPRRRRRRPRRALARRRAAHQPIRGDAGPGAGDPRSPPAALRARPRRGVRQSRAAAELRPGPAGRGMALGPPARGAAKARGRRRAGRAPRAPHARPEGAERPGARGAEAGRTGAAMRATHHRAAVPVAAVAVLLALVGATSSRPLGGGRAAPSLPLAPLLFVVGSGSVAAWALAWTSLRRRARLYGAAGSAEPGVPIRAGAVTMALAALVPLTVLAIYISIGTTGRHRVAVPPPVFSTHAQREVPKGRERADDSATRG